MYETLKFTEMTTRRVIDAKDKDGEKVYVKGHAKATYMSDGRTVDEAVNNKVDKVDGKQLSTEDFTTLLKQKLEGLSNYDDTEISQAVSKLRTDLDTLVSGDTTTAIKTFNEVIAFLDGIKDNQDLSNIIASIEQQIARKMDKVTLASVATSGSYNDLKDKPTIPSAVTESTVSDWGFTKNKGTITEVKMNGVSKGTSGVVDLGDVLTMKAIANKADKIPVINHGTNDTSGFILDPNKFHKWSEVSSLEISSIEATTDDVYTEYMFEFVSGATATTLSLPAIIKFENEVVIEPNKTYQVSIVNNIGVIIGV